MTRAEQLADAFEAIARVNHYMVGIIDEEVTLDELDDAEQILITRQNDLPGERVTRGVTSILETADYACLDLALDMLAGFRDSLT